MVFLGKSLYESGHVNDVKDSINNALLLTLTGTSIKSSIQC